jgi:hypothetical protein
MLLQFLLLVLRSDTGAALYGDQNDLRRFEVASEPVRLALAKALAH